MTTTYCDINERYHKVTDQKILNLSSYVDLLINTFNLTLEETNNKNRNVYTSSHNDNYNIILTITDYFVLSIQDKYNRLVVTFLSSCDGMKHYIDIDGMIQKFESILNQINKFPKTTSLQVSTPNNYDHTIHLRFTIHGKDKIKATYRCCIAVPKTNSEVGAAIVTTDTRLKSVSNKLQNEINLALVRLKQKIDNYYELQKYDNQVANIKHQISEINEKYNSALPVVQYYSNTVQLNHLYVTPEQYEQIIQIVK